MSDFARRLGGGQHVAVDPCESNKRLALRLGAGQHVLADCRTAEPQVGGRYLARRLGAGQHLLICKDCEVDEFCRARFLVRGCGGRPLAGASVTVTITEPGDGPATEYALTTNSSGIIEFEAVLTGSTVTIEVNAIGFLTHTSTYIVECDEDVPFVREIRLTPEPGTICSRCCVTPLPAQLYITLSNGMTARLDRVGSCEDPIFPESPNCEWTGCFTFDYEEVAYTFETTYRNGPYVNECNWGADFRHLNGQTIRSCDRFPLLDFNPSIPSPINLALWANTTVTQNFRISNRKGKIGVIFGLFQGFCYLKIGGPQTQRGELRRLEKLIIPEGTYFNLLGSPATVSGEVIFLHIAGIRQEGLPAIQTYPAPVILSADLTGSYWFYDYDINGCEMTLRVPPGLPRVGSCPITIVCDCDDPSNPYGPPIVELDATTPVLDPRCQPLLTEEEACARAIFGTRQGGWARTNIYPECDLGYVNMTGKLRWGLEAQTVTSYCCNAYGRPWPTSFCEELEFVITS